MTCCSTADTTQTHNQKYFAISQVAADWHEPMLLQSNMQPHTASANKKTVPAAQLQPYHHPNHPH